MTIRPRYEQPEPVGDEMTEPRFGIGSPSWPGLAKLAEECGELTQVLGKILAYPDQAQHPDGTNTEEKLYEEIADLTAALAFFVGANKLSQERLDRRIEYKVDRFSYWHAKITEARG